MGKQRRRDRWPELCKLVESDDGLPVNTFGQWTEQKLHFWNRYIEITTSAMVEHPNWPAGLTYVDLFAGAGICRIEGSGRRLPGSPLIAACAPKPFRQILLCEKDDALARVCADRINRAAPNAPVRFFHGDCNERAQEIARHIPSGALTLAFIDPQGMDVEFESVRVLAKRGRVDLLILLADAVDFVRNVDTYLGQNDSKVDKFLGADSNWRTKWRALGNADGPSARRFIAEMHEQQLRKLGYVRFGKKPIRSNKGPIYSLIYASKHERGLEFWEKVTKKDVGGQTEFF